MTAPGRPPSPAVPAARPAARTDRAMPVPPPKGRRPATALEGVDAGEGLALLADLVDEVAFLDRSAFLPSSFRPVPGWLRHEAVSPLLTAPAAARAPRSRGAGGGARRMAVAFAPEHGDHARRWAQRHGHRLLAPPAAITARAADKIHCLELLAEAGVDVPDHLVVPAGRRRPASAYWPAGWEAAVLQRRENNLLGRGTVPVHGPVRLAQALDRWHGHTLKLSRLVPGLSLTVSACAGADRTVVSAVSHQLVGVPGLTPAWGTHCGNQLLGPSDLPAPLHTRVRETARAVGDVLRGHGFRGVFGLDLVADGGRPLVVEINPRFQTVVSLVQAAEAAAGLLPALGLHVLACLLPALPAVREATGPVPPLSQLIVHAARPRRVHTLPAPGHYRLTDSALQGPLPAAPLPGLPRGSALLWPHASPGPVDAGDELVLLQTGHRLCALAPRPRLDARARAWTEHLHALTGDAA
ncbi:ATP-grasp domain-containing protein [Streptomyces aidingensis]|uniref:ATP-grasp domain-containing protein n=1 Tax=Streptomyces aidingensis TaxID=910347 RepID=A0A1I1N735_9ACTN|nr:ATP-grasp domain-containing protein [Streptomyces aidingensis]SFC93156.1 ATP-grasp domain-containing protein [Streptomyces aidingensis]